MVETKSRDVDDAFSSTLLEPLELSKHLSSLRFAVKEWNRRTNHLPQLRRFTQFGNLHIQPPDSPQNHTKQVPDGGKPKLHTLPSKALPAPAALNQVPLPREAPERSRPRLWGGRAAHARPRAVRPGKKIGKTSWGFKGGT